MKYRHRTVLKTLYKDRGGEHNQEVCPTSVWQNQHLHQGGPCKKEALSTKTLGATNPAYPSCSVKRAVYQGGHIWGKTLLRDPVLPSPTDWGWVRTEGIYEPHWTTLPQASKVCNELISCGCKSGCRKCCRCKKAALLCTGLCFCEGECSSWV